MKRPATTIPVKRLGGSTSEVGFSLGCASKLFAVQPGVPVAEALDAVQGLANITSSMAHLHALMCDGAMDGPDAAVGWTVSFLSEIVDAAMVSIVEGMTSGTGDAA